MRTIMVDPRSPLRLIPRWNHAPLSRLIPHWKTLLLVETPKIQ
jgi:hypothetical protein